MKILIYGGSFNPPHLGHFNIAKAAFDFLNPDRFLIIPANIPPHKMMDADSPTPVQRLEMCKLAFGGLTDDCRVEISDLELQREGKSYTVYTLEELHLEFPQDELFLLIGSDSFFDFEKWYRFEDIMKLCTLCVSARENGIQDRLFDQKKEFETRYSAKSVIIPSIPLEASSSSFRQSPGNTALLSPAVSDYIHCNKLYKT